MLERCVLESRLRERLFHGLQNIRISITKNMWAFHFVIKTENGKYTKFRRNTTFQEELQSQITELLLFLMKQGREGLT